MSRTLREIAKMMIIMILAGAAAPVSADESSAFSQRFSALFFGEIDWREREDQGDDGFVIGQSVAQFNAQLANRLTAFTELTATARKGESFEFEVERLFVRYDFSDYFKLSGGRYHTPLGYWNSAYHHGAWLQTTISRPETVKFGSDVVPIHFVGMLAEGNFGQSDFGYKLGFGNGRSEDKISDPGDLGDTNSNPAWLIAVNYKPPGRHRLNVGISLYVDRLRVEPVPNAETTVDEQIISAYLALEGETPEVITEYTYSYHDSSDSDASVHSVYGQLAYRLPGWGQSFKPYARVEWLDVEDDDPLLGGRGLDYKGVVAGVRWDFSPYSALKVEGRREDVEDVGIGNAIWVQLTFVFDATGDRPPFFERAPNREGTR